MSASIHTQIERAQGGKKLSFTVISPKVVKEKEFLFRALPYKHGEDKNPFVEVHVHNNIGKEQNEYAMCPAKTLGEECPYCNNAKYLRENLEKEDWKKIAKRFYPGSNVYIPGIARYEKYSEIAFLKVSAYKNFQQQIVGILTNKQLKKLFKLNNDLDFIKVWDLKEGLDFVVKKLDKSKESKYEQFLIENELELTSAIKRDEEKQLLKDYVADTPDVLKEMVDTMGCTTKINEIFIKQYPKHAARMKMIPESDVTETSEEILPEQKEDTSSESLPDDVSDLIDTQIETNDSTQDSEDTQKPENDDMDDEYKKLMEDLES